MDRNLTIVATSSVLVVVGLLTSLAMVTTYKDEEMKPDSVCFSSECFRAASTIVKSIDPKINPCNNFYDFSCGGYMKSAPIPDGEIRADPLTKLNSEIQQRIKESMEEPSSPDEVRSFRLAKDMYRACMNTSTIEKLGFKSLNQILERFGKWPVVEGDNWNEDGFSWVESTYTARNIGYSADYFITLRLGTDWKDNNKYVLMFDLPSFGLYKQLLDLGMGIQGVQSYRKYMIEIAVLMGADRERATRELTEALKFEIALAQLALPDNEKRNYTLSNNPMSVAEMRRQFPSVNWEEYINNQLAPIVRVNASEVITLAEPSFITGLEKLIRDTPKRVQANYVGWRVVLKSIDYLHEEVTSRASEFTTAVTGDNPGSRPRWKKCIGIIAETSLSISANALYVRKHFKEEARHTVTEMVNDIRNELLKILQKADWMDEQTRRKAMEKAVAMFGHIAYPVELLDDKEIDGIFKNLELSSNDLLGNMLNLTHLETEFTFNKLRKPVNKTEWATHEESTEVNAFYAPTDNSIQIPAGILQGILFSNDRPRYMNYGAIGYFIGHEMTHSFDNEGRQFDKDGNLVDWWTPETERKYLEKSQCMIDQYSNYTLPSFDMNVDGENTLGENIADNGGIKVAYFAYKEYVKRNGPEPKLPSLDYTPEQLFWISNANVWCTRYRPETAKYELTLDVHTPERFRVIGSISNMPEFAADFNCPLNSNMNPVHKCSVL